MKRKQFMNYEILNSKREAGSTTTGMSSLPEEILVDIFMELPVKSISISRCVCKLWCNLLSSHRFIKHHLINNAIQNKNHHKIMLIDNLNWLDRKYFSIYSMEFASVTSSPLPSFSGAVKLDCAFENNKEHNHVEILGSCNGLVCLGMYSVEKRFDWEYKYRICIWNPLTGKYKEILAPISNIYRRYGFGYDCNNDTYKLVRIGKNEETGSNGKQVYTLGSDSWSKMQAIPYSFPRNHYHMKDAVLLSNGALHWLGINTTRETSIIIGNTFYISWVLVGFILRQLWNSFGSGN
ncbi:F-box/kelch-repeat protein At3g06240-like [Papaver somniferum]|uniref:F-box/kelch-repeat protein At3g06240-like n=1 Tax=Papaver somniferum TaxID=3469 RepID=UPI000E6FE988|nr:F-box/kelch-repeat protein At3g06240-like [Papaver somniferum]